MIHTRSFPAFQDTFILLLGILTFFSTHAFSHRVVRGERLESSNSPDESKRESFMPRDHLSNEATLALPVDWNNDGSSFDHPISAATWNGPGQYELRGTSGVSAMQISVVDNRYVIIFDKAEHNPLKTSDGNHAWSALYDSSAHTVRALKLVTNSFCAGELYIYSCNMLQFGVLVYSFLTIGGGWLGNGTLIDFGGSSRENIPSGNGIMGIRLFTPKPNGGGTVFEDPANLHLTSNRWVHISTGQIAKFKARYCRWYPSSARLSDGSQIIFGGMIAGGFNNKPSTDNPTVSRVLNICQR